MWDKCIIHLSFTVTPTGAYANKSFWVILYYVMDIKEQEVSNYGGFFVDIICWLGD